MGVAHFRGIACRISATRRISHSRDRHLDTAVLGCKRVRQGIATMISTDKPLVVQNALETTAEHDFVPPQASVDPTRQRETQEKEAAQTYTLQQASPNVQNLAPLYNATGPSYTIRVNTVGSFLKPQSHMLIIENPRGLHVAEIRFQIRGYDATMIYKNASTSQKLALQNQQEQEFQLLINGKPHRWRPLGPSKSVFELTREANKRVALFVYAEGMAQRTASNSGGHMPFQEQKIGEVHFMEDFLREPIALQQTLFSAVVVVEQAKRRATSIASWMHPHPSKGHSPGRRGSRQDGAAES